MLDAKYKSLYYIILFKLATNQIMKLDTVIISEIDQNGDKCWDLIFCIITQP